MVSLVLAYFYVPVARPFFNVLSDWNVHGGLAFSFIAMGATVGGLTETFIVYLHKGGRWTREDLINMAFTFLVFGLLGIMNSGLYQLQARWFGAGRSLGTLALKTSVDQFIYTPFFSNPVQTLAFLWKAEDFSLRSTVAKLSHFIAPGGRFTSCLRCDAGSPNPNIDPGQTPAIEFEDEGEFEDDFLYLVPQVSGTTRTIFSSSFA